MTNERSIILRPHEVRGLLDGTVTCLWRPAKEFVARCDTWPDEVHPARESGWVAWWGPQRGESLAAFTKQQYRRGIPCPWSESGQRLWGRETWCEPLGRVVLYRADGEKQHVSQRLPLTSWRSSAQMPRWASRIALEIERVRPVRVGDATLADIEALGIPCNPMQQASYRNDGYRRTEDLKFQWNADNPRYPWESGPWAWQIVVRRAES